MGILDGFFKAGDPNHMDPKKFKVVVKQENGGKSITETYHDPDRGIYYTSTRWIHDDLEPQYTKEQMEEALKKAVEAEDFETAALIRDQLKITVAPSPKSEKIKKLEDQIKTLLDELNTLKNG